MPGPILPRRDDPRLFDALLVISGVAFHFLSGTVAQDPPAAALGGPKSSDVQALGQLAVVLHERMFAGRSSRARALFLRQREVQATRDESDEKRVLGDALILRRLGDGCREVGGKAYEFVGGHGGHDSTCTSATYASICAINKQGSRRANVQPSYSREIAL